jgi:proteic killer suppression protein
VEVEFKDKHLEKIEIGTAKDIQKAGVPLEVIEQLRSRLEFLRSAPDERTLRNWKSLHYEKLKGDRDGERSIRLNKKWRLIFTMDDSRTPAKITVLQVEDYH